MIFLDAHGKVPCLLKNLWILESSAITSWYVNKRERRKKACERRKLLRNESLEDTAQHGLKAPELYMALRWNSKITPPGSAGARKFSVLIYWDPVRDWNCERCKMCKSKAPDAVMFATALDVFLPPLYAQHSTLVSTSIGWKRSDVSSTWEAFDENNFLDGDNSRNNFQPKEKRMKRLSSR